MAFMEPDRDNLLTSILLGAGGLAGLGALAGVFRPGATLTKLQKGLQWPPQGNVRDAYSQIKHIIGKEMLPEATSPLSRHAPFAVEGNLSPVITPGSLYHYAHGNPEKTQALGAIQQLMENNALLGIGTRLDPKPSNAFRYNPDEFMEIMFQNMDYLDQQPDLGLGAFMGRGLVDAMMKRSRYALDPPEEMATRMLGGTDNPFFQILQQRLPRHLERHADEPMVETLKYGLEDMLGGRNVARQAPEILGKPQDRLLTDIIFHGDQDRFDRVMDEVAHAISRGGGDEGYTRQVLNDLYTGENYKLYRDMVDDPKAHGFSPLSRETAGILSGGKKQPRGKPQPKGDANYQSRASRQARGEKTKAQLAQEAKQKRARAAATKLPEPNQVQAWRKRIEDFGSFREARFPGSYYERSHPRAGQLKKPFPAYEATARKLGWTPEGEVAAPVATKPAVQAAKPASKPAKKKGKKKQGKKTQAARRAAASEPPTGVQGEIAAAFGRGQAGPQSAEDRARELLKRTGARKGRDLTPEQIDEINRVIDELQ